MTTVQLFMFILKLLTGTGVFLAGVHLLTANIEQLATGKIRELFGKTADSRLANMSIGAAATALIQSSGVTTVLIVGFVNVGVMNLRQAAAMIMGANIGTTITAQIAALSAFPVSAFIQAAVFAGTMMSMVCRGDTVKKTGFILAGLGLIFTGLSLMSDAMKANRDAVQLLFESADNPAVLFFSGLFLTALVQSSSATTSVIISMSVAGLTIGTGGNEVLYIILGTNIGSCVTALISCYGAGINARRAAFIHLLFNTVGAAVFLVPLLCRPDLMESTFGRWFPSPAGQIAMFHTFFNVVCTAIFLPFCGLFVRASTALIRQQRSRPEEDGSFLDERMLSCAGLAISQLKKELFRLSDTAMDAFRLSCRAFGSRDRELIEPTQRLIGRADDICRGMTVYLTSLSAQSKLSDERHIYSLHSSLADAMRIAEIADNFTKYTQKTIDNNLEFSDNVSQELHDMTEQIERLYALVKRAVLDNEPGLLSLIDCAENDIDALRVRFISRHIERLSRGECMPESSGIFINMISNLERLGDHLTYIAQTVLQ